MKTKIKIALCQINCKRENKEANLNKIEELTLKAKQQGADLAIFPEISPASIMRINVASLVGGSGHDSISLPEFFRAYARSPVIQWRALRGFPDVAAHFSKYSARAGLDVSSRASSWVREYSSANRSDLR